MTLCLVIGASGKTGLHVIEGLLRYQPATRTVRAVSRSRTAMEGDAFDDRVIFIPGDVTKDDPRPWMQGADTVVFCAAGSAATEHAVDHLGAKRCAEAATDVCVPQFILVSALGAHDPSSWGDAFFSYLSAKAAGERSVFSAFPKATVLRPGILTDGPATGTVVIRNTPGPGDLPVSRADVAKLVVSCVGRTDVQGMTLEIVGGDTKIDEALVQALQKM